MTMEERQFTKTVDAGASAASGTKEEEEEEAGGKKKNRKRKKIKQEDGSSECKSKRKKKVAAPAAADAHDGAPEVEVPPEPDQLDIRACLGALLSSALVLRTTQ